MAVNFTRTTPLFEPARRHFSLLSPPLPSSLCPCLYSLSLSLKTSPVIFMPYYVATDVTDAVASVPCQLGRVLTGRVLLVGFFFPNYPAAVCSELLSSLVANSRLHCSFFLLMLRVSFFGAKFEPEEFSVARGFVATCSVSLCVAPWWPNPESPNILLRLQCTLFVCSSRSSSAIFWWTYLYCIRGNLDSWTHVSPSPTCLPHRPSGG
eukprot:RCo037909